MGEGLYKKIRYLWNCFLEVMYPLPKSCSMCGRVLKQERHYLCLPCLTKLKLIEEVNNYDSSYLQIRGGDVEPKFDDWISVCVYEGEAREMIHRLKYGDKREIAFSIASLMEECLSKRSLSYDLIIPVPLSQKRLRKRGYNQSELIAAELSNIVHVPYKLALEKPRDTASQVLYNAEERWYNVKDAFLCHANLNGDTVLLVDDVITTGATAHYCAEELKAKGAAKVYVISFAKASL